MGSAQQTEISEQTMRAERQHSSSLVMLFGGKRRVKVGPTQGRLGQKAITFQSVVCGACEEHYSEPDQ